MGDLGDFGFLCHETPLEHHRHRSSVKKMNTFPEEIDLDVVPGMHNFDSPKGLRFEVLDAEITINYKSECRELTGSWSVISSARTGKDRTIP